MSTLLWRCPRCDAPLLAGAELLRCMSGGHEFAVRDGIARFVTGAPCGFGNDRREHLASIENDHFWFPPRATLLARRAKILCRGPGTRVVELGCGTGTFLSQLSAFAKSVVGIDAYAESLATAKTRAPRATLVQADVTDVPLGPEQADLVVCLDVLEHVEPLPLLLEARRLAHSGAHLLMSVPAFSFLWSARDTAAGHRRRYTRATLARELWRGGWRLQGSTHYQFLLFGLVVASRKLTAASTTGFERRPPPWLGALLGAINRLEVEAFSRTRLPWGSSLIGWARRA